VQDDKEIAVEFEDDAFAEAAEAADFFISASVKGGSTVRRRKGLVRRILVRAWPIKRGVRDSM